MAKIAILLYAEAARFAPSKRLVVPETASVKTNVAADRTHIAQDWRGHSSDRFPQNRKTAANKLRIFYGTERNQRTDLGPMSRNGTDRLKLFDATNVEQILWREQPLLHRGHQIGAAGDDLNISRVRGEMLDCVFDAARAQKFECRQAQSSPAAGSVAAPERAGSAGWRAGPRPLNHKLPPCSRKFVG